LCGLFDASYHQHDVQTLRDLLQAAFDLLRRSSYDNKSTTTCTTVERLATNPRHPNVLKVTGIDVSTTSRQQIDESM